MLSANQRCAGWPEYRTGFTSVASPSDSSVHGCVQPGNHIGLTRQNGGRSCTPSVRLGISGAYPGPGSFMISARGTKLDTLIAEGETPREARELLEVVELEPSNVIVGPATIRDPMTTVVIPAAKQIWIDPFMILHYQNIEGTA